MGEMAQADKQCHGSLSVSPGCDVLADKFQEAFLLLFLSLKLNFSLFRVM